MADLKLEIPIVGNTPNTAIDKNIVEKIKREYGNDIKEVSDITNVPEQLITSIIYVESKGDATATNSRTIGLMQLDPITAVSCIVLEITKDRLSQKEKDILGITDTKLFDNIIKLGKGVDMKAYQNSFIPASALVKPMLLNKKKNILLGAAALVVVYKVRKKATEIGAELNEVEFLAKNARNIDEIKYALNLLWRIDVFGTKLVAQKSKIQGILETKYDIFTYNEAKTIKI